MTPFWTPERHRDRAPFLRARTAIVRAVREWFYDQGFTEVDPGGLCLSPGAEIHTQAFAVDGRFLHTSPEFAMKKLLAAGEEKIFFLGKCWRKGEQSPLHAEEFTMLEWYRAHAPYEQVMEDCVALARTAAAAIQSDALRWRQQHCDPALPVQKLRVQDALAILGVQAPLSHDAFAAAIVKVEPDLGAPSLTILYEYPLSEAALARRCSHDSSVAERFELYACGVELANGFGELTDPKEQRERLIADMNEKQARYGVRWPIDEDFLAALALMPPASGVALGLDRLVMLAAGARHIEDVLWTPR